MLDGYGDGWNGAYIDIIGSNNDFSYMVDLKKEGLDTVVKTITLCPDDYSFLWHWGEFDEEISFSILFDGAEIYKADTGEIDAMFNINFLNYEINCNKDDEENDDEENENVNDIMTSSVNIHPSPVSDKLYIETQTLTQTLTIEIYDVYGRQQSMVNGQQSTVIDVTNLNSGVYFVKVVTKEGETVKRFIKD